MCPSFEARRNRRAPQDEALLLQQNRPHPEVPAQLRAGLEGWTHARRRYAATAKLSSPSPPALKAASHIAILPWCIVQTSTPKPRPDLPASESDHVSSDRTVSLLRSMAMQVFCTLRFG